MGWIYSKRALARLLPIVVALGVAASLTMIGPAPGARASGSTQPSGHAVLTPAGVVNVSTLPPAGGPEPFTSRPELHSPYDNYTGPATVPGQEVKLVQASTDGPLTQGGPTPALLSATNGIGFTGWEPPDTQLGVGPTRVVEMVNLSGRILTKGGTTVSTFALGTFFGAPSISIPSPNYSDPRVYFDASSGRWFATILVYDGGNYNSEIRLAVSQTSDPAGLWTQYAAEWSTAGVLFDQPRLGVNDDKVLLTHDDFSTSTYLGEKYSALNKANLLAGATVAIDLFPREAGKRWLIPARSLSSTTTEYAVHGAGTALTVYAFTGIPGVGAGSSFTTTALTIGSLAAPPDAAQPGGGPVDTGSSNVESVMWRAGTLWSAATDGCTPSGDTTTRACLRFDKVSTTGTPSLVADTRIAASGSYLYYPSVVTTGAGDVFAAFTVSSATLLPSAEAIYGQGGSWGSSVPGVLYQAGAAAYPGGRWGDYSEIAVDPANDDDVWAAEEYAASSWWGTSIGQLTAVPPTVTSVVPSSGPNNGGTVVDVYGREFARNGSVTFGGTTVSFTWVDSTHITVTSPAHPVGTVDIRVTNAAGTSAATAADQFTYTHRGGTRAQAHVTMHRFSGNVVLLAAPSAGLGWVCRDVHTNAVVTAGATLSAPSPGVRCDPPPTSSDSCTALDAGGYHAVAGGGTLVVRSKCDTLTATQSLTLPFSDPGYSTTVTGTAYTPWQCEADESGLTGPLSSADYWVFCDINVP